MKIKKLEWEDYGLCGSYCAYINKKLIATIHIHSNDHVSINFLDEYITTDENEFYFFSDARDYVNKKWEDFIKGAIEE